MLDEQNAWANKEAQKEALEQMALRIAELIKKVNDLERNQEGITDTTIILEENDNEMIERITEVESIQMMLQTKLKIHTETLNLHNDNNIKIESEK
jgi:hypothetical protein